MGFLADEDRAIMWRGLVLNRAVQQFLQDAHWGDLDYLLIDLPPGTGDVQMGLARHAAAHRDARRHDAAARRPEGGGPGRRHGPAGLPAGGRRDREHERLHLRARHHLRALRHRRRRPAGRRARGAARRQRPAPPRHRGRRRRRAPGRARRRASWPTVFAELARAVAEEVAPVVETSGCTARLLDRVARGGGGRAGASPPAP